VGSPFEMGAHLVTNCARQPPPASRQPAGSGTERVLRETEQSRELEQAAVVVEPVDEGAGDGCGAVEHLVE